MTKIKLCGLTRPCDIEAVNALKPEYIGFVFAPGSKRYIDAKAAAGLKKMLHAEIQAVGVFVNDDPAHIAALADSGVIDLIQLHGGESAAYIERLQTMTAAPIICAVRVGANEDIKRVKSYPVEYFLLDACTKGAYGGSGETFDWSLIGAVGKPYFLAGGLNESNIACAMQTGAYALDLSSGIETDGVKDAGKMRRVAALVKGGQP